jgi:membrane fusion protein (multidrug efflux system)
LIKRFIIAIVLLVIVVGGIVGFNMFRDQAIEQFFANMPVQPVTVSTVKVEPATWTPGIDAIGTVGAARGVNLTVETSGIVSEVFFTANEKVEAGKVLVQLEDAVQRADLAVGQTQAALDQQALDRALELQKRGVGSDVAVDTARAAASTSASQVARLQAVLDQRQLRAPFDGIMGIPRVEAGQYIAPSATVATLQDMETMRTDFAVPEQQLSLLKIGGPVSFGVTAADMAFNGSITGIEPKVDPTSRLVSVRAEIANPEGRLSPGQFLRVRVQLPEETGVLAIPQTALVASLYGDFVFVVRPAPAKPDAPAPGTPPSLIVNQVFVQVGRRSGRLVEIVSGIAAGDEIVSAGQNRLANNTPVTIDNTVNPGVTGNQQAAE